MKKIVRRVQAGTLESSDVFVTLEPCENGRRIEIDSVVQAQFGQAILETVEDVLDELGVESVCVKVVDRGALDCVLRARVETAVLRGREM